MTRKEELQERIKLIDQKLNAVSENIRVLTNQFHLLDGGKQEAQYWLDQLDKDQANDDAIANNANETANSGEQPNG